jgi:thiol:disulfide interchange protein DsbA
MQKRTFLKLGLIGLFSLTSGLSFALTEGKDYKKVLQQQSIEPHAKQVVEVFYYGCSHCYHLEPSLHEWLKKKPAKVNFKRVPAVLNNPNWVFMAKVYLTAEELGIVEKSHLAFFHALHRDKLPLFDLASIAKFHSQFGTSEQAFIDTFQSFKIDQKMRQAQRLTKAYGIEGVPSLIVNGQYLTDLTMTGSHDNLWQTVDQLLEK